ncbi:hypothetical protein GCM10009801_45820 [Streptomyces albiaxialis]|uniref:Small hydrophilic protein n=1 Tax=Streptomyces albiaxialis TaxID=329523 RepID=A0ABN2W8G3_9ACTN
MGEINNPGDARAAGEQMESLAEEAQAASNEGDNDTANAKLNEISALKEDIQSYNQSRYSQ